MSTNPSPPFDRPTFLLENGITPEEFRSTGLEWSLLDDICAHHEKAALDLQTAATYIAQRLQQVAAVHSLKVRIKSPEHLAAKVIRKKFERPSISFDVSSYQSQVTDLIGLRALHLFKDEWRSIHEFVQETWTLHEKPIAYVRKGDHAEELSATGFDVIEHTFGYRSIHYVLESQPDKKTTVLAELQVRTIFEEGWSEIDHRVRYPRRSQDPYLSEFLGILNRLCGSADEMGTFIKTFQRFTSEQNERIKEQDRRIEERETELRKTVSTLKITKAEKDSLDRQIEALRRSSQPAEVPKFFSAGTTAFPTLSSLMGTDFSSVVLPQVSVIGATSSFLGPMEAKEQTCTSCKKTYTEPSYMASINFNRCPDCRMKTFGL